MNGASAGYGLERDDTLLCYCGAVWADNQTLSGGSEFSEAGYGKVLVVEVRIFAEDLVSLLDERQSIGT